MAPAKPVKKPGTGSPGVKLFITAASLAATLGGWALLSRTDAKPAADAAPVPAPAAASPVTIKLAPLPTLVPPITPQPQLVTIDQPRPAARAPQQPVPPQTAPTELVLRDVSAPQINPGGSAAPAPVANTRSSR